MNNSGLPDQMDVAALMLFRALYLERRERL